MTEDTPISPIAIIEDARQARRDYVPGALRAIAAHDGAGSRCSCAIRTRPGFPSAIRKDRSGPAALDGYSLKIVGWRPVTGEA